MYTKLYLEFGLETFTFNDAMKILGRSEGGLMLLSANYINLGYCIYMRNLRLGFIGLLNLKHLH